MGLDVPGIVLQRECEVVERLRELAALEIDDAEVAISLRHVIAFSDRFLIMLGRRRVALLVKQQRLFERREQARESLWLDPKEIELSLQLSFDLANAMTLCAQLTHTPELRQRIEVVNKIGRFGSWRRL